MLYNNQKCGLLYKGIEVKCMITYKGHVYYDKDIIERVMNNDIEDLTDLIIELLRSCFFTEDGIAVVDGTGNVLMTNEAHKKIMNTEGKSIVGTHVDDLVKKGVFQESASRLVMKSLRQESITQRLANGKVILTTATPIFDQDNNLLRIINNVRDMPILNELFEEKLKQEMLLNTYKTELKKLDNREREVIVAASKSMRHILSLAEKAAMNNSNVLIQGETGVGKGVIAKLIYDMSMRNDKPMISINCGAIPENLLESELFGYAPGAFTGASSSGKAGLFEIADKGVIFLDEIGELHASLQPKLLSFLETGEFVRVGSTKVKKVDCRIIAATNKNLKEMVDAGEFRKDLYYRLNIIPIYIPPLRNRREDIIPLAIKFLKEINEKYGTSKTISYKLLKSMEIAEWEGNVRELRAVIERCVVLNQSDEVLSCSYQSEDDDESGNNMPFDGSFPIELREVLEKIEKKYICIAIEKTGSVRKAAALLNIPPSTLFRKLNKK